MHWNRAIYYFLGLLKEKVDDSICNAACEALATIVEKNCFEKFAKEPKEVTEHSFLEGDTQLNGFSFREKLKNEILKQVCSQTGEDENSFEKAVSSFKFLKVILYVIYIYIPLTMIWYAILY